MDSGVDHIIFYAIFLASTFAAALVAGLAGFAFGIVAAAVWLYILPPIQVATLIVVFGLLVQGYAVWKLRGALDWKRLWPFVVGALFGVPIGVAILATVNPAHVRNGVGALLVLHGIYGLVRPTIKFVTGGTPVDAGVGFLNGVLGGTTGLAGIVVTIWCQLRGWPNDEQRAVFQPVAVATFAVSAVWLGRQEPISADLIRLVALGLPVLLAGTWTGLKLYSRLDQAQFRKVVLVLLMISGVVLLFR
jgi:uncharacterized membrane protein YfcA